MTDPQCPSCGERDRLTGQGVDGEIELACRACGHRWMRGQRRCRGCGGVEQVLARRGMTTYPRGNQLAVVGMRDVPLCPSCDSEALAGLGDDRLLDDSYRSRFVSGPGVADQTATPRTAPPSTATPRTAPTRTSPPTTASSGGPELRSRSRETSGETSPGQPVPGTAPGSAARRHLPTPAPSPAAASSSAAPGASPTVRHAVHAYLEQAPDAVSATAMLVLGRTLGPTTRLRDVTAAASTSIADAVDQHWSGQPSLRRLAMDAINDAFRFWRSKGWIDAEQSPSPGADGLTS